jgi:hypothetical protein
LSLIYDENYLKVTFATIGFRRLLSQEKNPPIQNVIDANLVPRFLALLQKEDLPKLQVGAEIFLTNFLLIAHFIDSRLFTKIIVRGSMVPDKLSQRKQ